jgi:uncharacterized protein YdhG (YjbR/CyaY superfamily)
MKSDATSVEAYLAELPEERRDAISAVREVILAHLPEGYREGMNWGMIAYEVPLDVYPETYNGQPLMYAALASQKNHMAVYLTGIYMNDADREEFEEAYRSTGKRFDVGKSGVRFRRLDDLPLDLIGDWIGRLPMTEFVERVEAVHSPRRGRQSGAGKPGSRKEKRKGR